MSCGLCLVLVWDSQRLLGAYGPAQLPSNASLLGASLALLPASPPLLAKLLGLCKTCRAEQGITQHARLGEARDPGSWLCTAFPGITR